MFDLNPGTRRRSARYSAQEFQDDIFRNWKKFVVTARGGELWILMQDPVLVVITEKDGAYCGYKIHRMTFMRYLLQGRAKTLAARVRIILNVTDSCIYGGHDSIVDFMGGWDPEETESE